MTDGAGKSRPRSKSALALNTVALLLIATAVWLAAKTWILPRPADVERIRERTVSPRPPSREPPPDLSYPEVIVSVSWLAANLSRQGLAIVDARGDSAYLEGHIPGAISLLPGPLLHLHKVREILAGKGLNDAGRVICYGEDSRSPDAAFLFWVLEAAGADSAAVLDGGFSRWLRLGGLTATAPSASLPGCSTSLPDSTRFASHQYVEEHFGAGGVEIIDSRSDSAWMGTAGDVRSGSNERTGHIPNSLRVDFAPFLADDGTFHDPAEMWRICSAVGPRPSSPVDLDSEFIVFGTGAAGDGALGYLLLRRAGIRRVRYYSGGWLQWVEDPAAPVVRIIGVDELRERLRSGQSHMKADSPTEDLLLLDVRDHRDYVFGHIPCAVGLSADDFSDSLEVVLARHWPSVERARIPIVLYCYGPDCIRSRYCSTLAAQKGFRVVEWFRGGIDDWKYIGEKLVRGD